VTKLEKIHKYTVIFEPAEEGGYVVSVPALPGCYTEGDTLEEAREMAREVIVGHIETLRELGQPIPEDIYETTQLSIEKLAIAV